MSGADDNNVINKTSMGRKDLQNFVKLLLHNSFIRVYVYLNSVVSANLLILRFRFLGLGGWASLRSLVEDKIDEIFTNFDEGVRFNLLPIGDSFSWFFGQVYRNF